MTSRDPRPSAEPGFFDRGGLRLAYTEAGAGEPTLLLLHGLADSRAAWSQVLPALAARRRVLLYDQRGHGASDHLGAAHDYTLDALTRDLEQFTLDRCPDRFDLVGHSMGGVVALRFALEHPQRLRSLALVSATAQAHTAIPAPILAKLASVARAGGSGALARFMEVLNPGAQPRYRGRMRADVTAMDIEAFLELSAELGRYPSLLDRLPELKLPVTLVVGEHDRLSRAGAVLMESAIPDAELRIVAGTGHSPHEQDPEAWIAILESHLAASESVSAGS